MPFSPWFAVSSKPAHAKPACAARGPQLAGMGPPPNLCRVFIELLDIRFSMK
jgi:hypothetical protein